MMKEFSNGPRGMIYLLKERNMYLIAAATDAGIVNGGVFSLLGAVEWPIRRYFVLGEKV